MEKSKKKNTNPEVRFKGFIEDWKHQELGQVLIERKEMQKISDDAPILAFASGQGVIDRSERKSNNRDQLTLDQTNKVYKLTEFNDIVYNPSNLKYGAIDRNKYGRGVISPIYVTFTTVEVPSFMELIVKSIKFRLRALRFEEGTVVKRQSVKPENLISLKVNISSSHIEQKRIGELFENFDYLISIHQEKYQKLVLFKKVMLEKMFPKNSTDLPEVRFKEFNGSWTKTKLSNISRKVIEKNSEFIINETFTNSARLGIITQRDFFDHDKSKKENLNGYYIVQNEDFVYNPRISKLAPVGPININKLARSGVMSPLYCVFRTHDVDNAFLEQYFKSAYWHSYMKLNGDSGARSDRISIKDSIFFEMPIPYPCPKEQKKIGKFLSNLDTLIELEKNELDKFECIKKACFQRMID
ncbi:restriction endonuclease subunit S [Flavobacterium tegetincola]|uniref:restriction endonuclease subunit S n=1 Tax=Flavobacterium tegetincola TaxID=150172 RepID=UPI000407CCD2|nr:restriction endonuclease subunit S [Flavobacterium tegetincola]